MAVSLKRFIRGAWGRLTFADWNSVLDRLDALESTGKDLRRQTRQPLQWFYAEIRGNQAIPSTSFRWLYSWRKVGVNPNDRDFDPLKKVGDVDDSSTIGVNAFALAALNGFESNNTASFAGGVDITQSTYTSCNLQPWPIATGTVVVMFALHGVLTLSQVTGGGTRSTIGYVFLAPTTHDKIGAVHP